MLHKPTRQRGTRGQIPRLRFVLGLEQKTQGSKVLGS
jgi:hypothetical protein